MESQDTVDVETVGDRQSDRDLERKQVRGRLSVNDWVSLCAFHNKG